MTTVTCANGHESADREWCDTCGAPIGAPVVAAPAAAPAGATPATVGSGSALPPETCPHCSTLNPASALFCESCGYDFTTGQAPEPIATPQPAVVPTAPAAASGWVLVVEVDPEWFGLKGELSDQPCPPATTRTVPLVAHTSLVGRSSQSKNVHPEIALDGDTGVSRRHAQFVRPVDVDAAASDPAVAELSVIDLSSTNGTYVVEAGQSPTALTEPIATGVAVSLRDGDRVYVGAWSRLTVRRTA